jgi:hypothetical protein
VTGGRRARGRQQRQSGQHQQQAAHTS